MVEGEKVNDWHYFVVVLLGTCSLLTVLVNIALITGILYTRKILDHSKNYVLLSLSVADLMIGLTSMPFGVVAYVNDHIEMNFWEISKEFRLTWSILNYVFDDVSMLHLVLINYIKYKSVQDPMMFDIWLTHTKIVVSLAGVWVGTLIVALLLNIQNIMGDNEDGDYKLTHSQIGFMLLEVPFIIVIASNIMVFTIVRKAAYRHVRLSIRRDTNVSYLFEKKDPAAPRRTRFHLSTGSLLRFRAIAMQTFNSRNVPVVKAGFNLFVQTTIFFVCWFPQAILYPFYVFHVILGETTFTEEELYQCPNFLVVSWFAWFNALMNPVLHVLFDHSIKEAFISSVRKNNVSHRLSLTGYRKSTHACPSAQVTERPSELKLQHGACQPDCQTASKSRTSSPVDGDIYEYGSAVDETDEQYATAIVKGSKHGSGNLSEKSQRCSSSVGNVSVGQNIDETGSDCSKENAKSAFENIRERVDSIWSSISGV